MNQPLQPLQDDLTSLTATWDGALPAFGVRTDTTTGDAGTASAVQVDVESMSDAGLIGVTDALARLIRDGNAVLVRVAAEVARRSPAEAGRTGLAKQHGFLGPTRLVAAATGGSITEASRLVSVGTATATRQSLTGQQLPPTHPHVAAALQAGGISVSAASAITTMLDRVARRANPGQAEAMEQLLAQKAADLPLEILYRLIREAEARLDADGVAPKEKELRADRAVYIRQDAHGMTHLSAHLDPESAAPVKAAIEAIVTKMLRARHDAEHAGESGGGSGGESGSGDTPVLVDTRTVPQLQADALTMIADHAGACRKAPAASATTVVVRIDLKTLTDGIGHGSIDGIDQPVSVETIRKLAAGANIIPQVLGTDSLPLDQGRAARLFSPGQRIALAERDGGCACCGLDAAYTQAHHIRWWERDTGPTDLTNGVLLCPPCHTRMHNDGWIITIDQHGRVWFTPPPHVDPDQKPRLGGTARYGLPDLDAA
ncbi:HNH endonuclease signature motif containing protein [Rathayibacter soli]|uniref:HNH endonuclease signature motif containing protein n=1 Tax=Rathayibacter soli TaxID=3144168 RepID=UPI0027E45E07|nr:DUF222 domain-containing protein [Glaciibacter superstes]